MHHLACRLNSMQATRLQSGKPARFGLW